MSTMLTSLPKHVRWKAGILLLLLLGTSFPLALGHPSSSTLTTDPPPPLAPPTLSAQDMYGIGNRLGSYFQATAFILGFANVTRLDPKSQFAGVILAFQLLVRWWSRHDGDQISASELWLGLAQLLAFTSPGCLLLYLSFSFQRRAWDDDRGNVMLRKNAVRGQGLNFLQAAVVVWWVNVTNSTFAYWIVAHKQGRDYPSVNDPPENPIWMLGEGTARSTWIKWFMVVQAIATTVCEIGPLMLYLAAWVESVRDYWARKRFQGREQPYAPIQGQKVEWTHFGLPPILQGRSNWLALFCGVLCTFYVIMLIISIEKTIIAAGLKPAMDVSTPGQLLPLIAGTVALVTAIANVGRPVSTIDQFRGGGMVYHKA